MLVVVAVIDLPDMVNNYGGYVRGVQATEPVDVTRPVSRDLQLLLQQLVARTQRGASKSVGTLNSFHISHFLHCVSSVYLTQRLENSSWSQLTSWGHYSARLQRYAFCCATSIRRVSTAIKDKKLQQQGIFVTMPGKGSGVCERVREIVNSGHNQKMMVGG